MLATIIASIGLLAVVSGAVLYLWRTRKSGPACAGCPLASACSGKNSSCLNAAQATGPVSVGIPSVRRCEE